MPELISGRAKVAVSEARIMSHDKAISRPPPQQMPLILKRVELWEIFSNL